MDKLVTLRLDEQQHEKLKEQANKLGMTISGYVRYLVLKSSEMKTKESKKKKL
uniref:OrfB n=2 Tax=Mycoplasma mycoides group TaxID=656088 RepID=Q7BL79_9MOLU|nr:MULTISPECIES: hypothetical protein [Mycoplasma mycoides group]AAA98480.1 hypothetical protein [Mycoplasma mycoides]AAG17633.1 OrfB [Mycoplasma leachii]